MSVGLGIPDNMLSSSTMATTLFVRSSSNLECKEGKEEYLYSAILADTILAKRSDMDHTVLAANYTMSAFPSQALITRRRHPN